MFKKFLFFVFCLLLAIPQSFAADLLDFVPAESELIIRSNIKQIMQIPLVKNYLTDNLNQQNNNEYIKQIEECGFNIFTDLDSAVLFMSLNSPNPQNPLNSDVAMVVNGNFNLEKSFEYLKSHKELSEKMVIAEEDGFQTITTINPEKGNSKILVIDSATVIAGSETGVNNAKMVKLGKKAGINTKKDFAAVLAKLNPKASLAAAAILPDETRQFLASNEQSKSLSDIQFLSLDFTKNDNLDINITGDFSASANMTEVTKALNSFFDGAKKAELPYEALIDFIKNTKISSKDSSAVITTFITQASIDKLIENFGSPKTNNK